ncbi:hypothetical protein BASA81_000339 [Batrachochytrium salamandrivorans]|nr:hypothetical protein BASA81_000339 [Batrachochytrium salamandrivorans]
MEYGSGTVHKIIRQLKPEENVYMCMNTTNKGARGWIALAQEEAVKKATKKNCGMYEVIVSDRPRQLYFDLDFKATDYLEEFKRIITAILPDAELQISGSKQEFKTSYHVVVSNYYFKNVDEQRSLKSFLQSKEIDGKPLGEIGVDLGMTKTEISNVLDKVK